MRELIRLDGISKIYRCGGSEVHALCDISLSVSEGEFIAITGASGSGKSTLMNTLGCLDRPTSGSYLLDGRDTAKMSEKELSDIRSRRIGFVFQGFNLIGSLSAAENVELPLFYRKMPSSLRRDIAREALCRVGLESRMEHRPSEMSGGQQQRVAIARALAADSPILLADEPTGNLDSRTGAGIMKLLTALVRDKKTVILITHDDSIASAAGRIVRIADGRIESDTIIA